jgi:GTP-binding protein EngB required for normal cell division
MLEYVQATGKHYIVLANKADKIAKTKVKSYVNDLAKTLKVDDDLIFPYSSETKEYVDEIWDVIYESLAND